MTNPRARLRGNLIVASLLLSACHVGGRRTATASTPSVCTTAGGVGRLTLTLITAPTVSQTTEALVRVESETERSILRVNAQLGTTFELRPGTYRLSISLPGYSSAERAATIECGSERTLSVSLAKKR